jgi:hypothetical protein
MRQTPPNPTPADSAAERHEVDTPFGPVWLWGRARGRPTLLVITGALARVTVMGHFAGVFPDLDVLRMHLPGNHSPRLADGSIGTITAALNDALRQVVDAPLAIIGLSAGGVVALGARHPQLCGLLLLDPPIRATEAWPLQRSELIAQDPVLFAALNDGDFSPLIDELTAPAEVMVGEEPLLPRRPFVTPPSLVDEETRHRLAAHALVTLNVTPGAGHLVQDNGPAFAAAVGRLVDRLRAAGGGGASA